MADTRIERDPLGEKAVPASALYGIQTLRAAENFPISGLRPLPAFVDAVVWIKRSAALTHKETGRLEPRLADAIVARRRRGSHRPAPRPVHRGRLSGRRGHQPQHERQRGARQPGQRDPRREARRVLAGAPERSRQHGAEHQRRDPHRDAPGDPGYPARCPPGAGAAGPLAARQGRRVRRHHQVGPDPPAGRHPDPPGPGVHRLQPHGRAAPGQAGRRRRTGCGR